MTPRTILVAEHDATQRAALVQALAGEGYDAAGYAAGEQLLADVARAVPSLIVTSMVLPDMAAHDLAARVRQLPAGASVPIIACSGFRAPGERSEADSAFAEVLFKPVAPAQLVRAAQAQLARTGGHARPGDGRHVLVVDDDPVGLKLARVRLHQLGFRVTTCAGARRALAAARAGRPDAILSDVLMPEMDGFELCLQLRADPELARVPVVLVSASYGERADRELAQHVGATALCARTPDLGEAIAALIACSGREAASASAEPATLAPARAARAQRQLDLQAGRAIDLDRRCALQHAILAAMASLADSLARTMDGEAALGAALLQVLDTSGLTRGAIFLRDGDGAPRLVAGSGLNEATRRALEGIGRAGEALREVFATEETVKLRSDDERPCAAFLEDAGLRSALLAPLVAGRDVLGAIFFASERFDLHDDDWLLFARTIGAHLGQACARAQSNAELDLSNRRHRMLMENAREAMFILKLTGEVVEINRACERLFGRPRGDIIGRNAWEFARPEDQEASRGRVQGTATQGDYEVRDMPILRPDGETVLVDFSVVCVEIGAESQLLCVGRDVTERRRAQDAAEASAARYRTLVENIPELVWSSDADRILFVNGASSRIHGMEPEAFRAMGTAGYLDRVHPDDRARSEAAFTAMFTHGVPMDEEHRFRHADGSWRWMHSRAHVARGADGAMIVEGLSADITERKAALLRLHESELQYRTIFETSPVPMFVVDVETRRFLSMNAAAVASYGYAREELLAMTAMDIRLPEDLPQLERVLAESRETTQRVHAVRHLRKDGSIVEVDVVAGPSTFMGRAARLVIATDVTEQRRAERRQAVVHAVTRAVAESRTLAEAAGRFLGPIASALGWGSAAIWEIEGGQRASCAGRFGPTEAESGERGLCWPVRAAGEVVAFLELGRPASSQSSDETVDLLGSIEAQLAQFIARARSEGERDKLARDLGLILSSTSEGICSVDLDGVCQVANAAAAGMLGYPVAELVGEDLHALTHHSRADGSAYPKADCAIQQAFRNGKGTARTDEVFWRKDGTSFAVTYRSAPILVDGAPRGAVVTFFDATHERRLELQLRQAQKMEAIGQLAGGVAHDFNNILAVILASAGCLLQDMYPTDPRRDDVEEVKASALRGASLTRQLLAFSRQQLLEPKVLDVNAVVTNIERMLRRLIGEDIELELGLDRELGAVRADAGQIEQVIMNLAVNARDAMPQGGRITIETAMVDIDEELAEMHARIKPGRYVMLAVSDTGTGMSAEIQRRIFEPFFTTKERGRGTGLGLSTCYGIVEQSGGTIWVYSEPGHGSVFKVYLPMVAGSAKPISRTTEPARSRGTETILLVEDDDRLRRVTRRILENSGYRVLEARDADEALAVAGATPGQIHLLLSDVVTPGRSGPQIAEEIVAARPDTLVLFMSGYTDHACLRDGALPAGAGFLQKPFTPEVLTRRVRDALDARPA